MQESYVEGVATHSDPESCVGAREGAGEALTGARTGRVSSREINRSERRRRPEKRKATRCAPLREVRTGSARSKTPSTCGTFLCENGEVLVLPELATRAAPGKPEAERRR
jgi:hypothetical protein